MRLCYFWTHRSVRLDNGTIGLFARDLYWSGLSRLYLEEFRNE